MLGIFLFIVCPLLVLVCVLGMVNALEKREKN